MKNIHINKDVVRLLAVFFLVALSGWGPVLVSETVAEPTAASEDRISDPFQEFHYDVESQVLAVTFRSGETYHYQQVPVMVYLDLTRIVNRGEYFAKHVRGCYAFERTGNRALSQLARQ